MIEKAKKLPLTQVADFLKRFRFIIFLTLFAAIYAYLFITINSLGNQAPSQLEVDQELQTVKRLRIDESSIDQMLKLTEENIEIKAAYDEARNNPFSE